MKKIVQTAGRTQRLNRPEFARPQRVLGEGVEPQ